MLIHPRDLDTKLRGVRGSVSQQALSGATKLRKGLALGELEALACFGLARFLALHHAGVAGHEAFAAESLLVFGVDFHQSAGDGETKSLGLAFEAASVEIHADVVFLLCLKFLQRLLNNVLENRRREVFVKRTVVDCDFAVAFGEDYAGDGGLAATYCINCFHCST